MKKVISLLIMVSALSALCANIANAQAEKSPYKFYVMTSGLASPNTGGFITGYNIAKGSVAESQIWGLHPEIGMYINSKSWVGLGLGYKNTKISYSATSYLDHSINDFGINPYYCYVIYGQGKFSIFLLGDVSYVASKYKGADNGSNSFGVGVSAIASFMLSDQFSMTAGIAGIRYTNYGSDSYQFNFTGLVTNGLSVSLIYSFGKN